jgi:protein-L-isoaspartate(D-aspartate) O-methyltransferase
VSEVDRAAFIPDVVWVWRDDGWMIPIDRAKQPERWLEIVRGAKAVITQVDDGHLTDGKGTTPTSSSSGLDVMGEMLNLLDVHAGMDVLEIGTGTGYNAALLAKQATPGAVTTVEIDATVAAHARLALDRAGYSVDVVTADGSIGYRENAPYDRVMATADVLTVPYPWVEQTRPGGRIVLPISGSFSRGSFLCLTVKEDGTATGHLYGGAAFMRLRGQRNERFVRWNKNTYLRESTSRLFPGEPFEEFEAGVVLGLLCPGWRSVKRVTDGVTFIEVSDAASQSGASLAADDTTADDEDFEIIQYGPRNLWDELEAAYQWWLDAGRPDHTRFGLTVTKEGQHVWLDGPGQVVRI